MHEDSLGFDPAIASRVDCTASDGKYFARFAKPVFDNGYSVISLYPSEKRPHIDIGWREACWSRLPERWLQEQVVGAPDSGVALACGAYTVAFDIDLMDPKSVETIRSMVFDVCGPTPLIRIGRLPRLALLYRSLEPVVSIRLPKFDILGLGGSLVAYGRHAKAGTSYQWVGGTAPHLIRLDEVPGVTNAQCVTVAGNVVRRIYGERFERFSFDTDFDLITKCFSSRSVLVRQLFTRLFHGKTGARTRFHTRVRNGEIPPGFLGFSMHPIVRGGFDYDDFLRRFSRGDVNLSDGQKPDDSEVV